jgi:hypothetical protein
MTHLDETAAVPRFDDLRAYCMFLGYPRSGHSLIGALLDAHPDVIMAHELDALRHVAAGCGRERLFALLLENSRAAAAGGRTWGEYGYAVLGGWQGRFRKLRVIGDKKGGGSLRRLRTDPGLLERLREVVGLDVKVVHVIRNPFDNIGTMARHRAERGMPLRKCIDSYFARCQTFAEARRQIADSDIREIRYESFLEDPRAHLGDLCRFLGVEPAADYLSACAAIVYETPHRSRHRVPWTEGLIDAVRRRLADYAFLAGYTFAS